MRASARLRNLIPGFVLVLMVALGGAPGAVASQAGLTGETAYSVSMSGATITWETDWEFVPRYNRVSETYDLIGLLSTTGFQMIGSLPTGTDPVAARDEFRVLFSEGATGIDNVEAGEYGTVAYALDLVDVRESVWAVFIVTSSATGYLMTYVTYAPADVLGTALDLARGSIEVDGLGILEGVDGVGVQAVVSAAAPNFEPDTVLE